MRPNRLLNKAMKRSKKWMITFILRVIYEDKFSQGSNLF
jgi:hypothetical protein